MLLLVHAHVDANEREGTKRVMPLTRRLLSLAARSTNSKAIRDRGYFPAAAAAAFAAVAAAAIPAAAFAAAAVAAIAAGVSVAVWL